MAPAPEALVLLLDAAVSNDDGMMRCLLRRFPSMAKRGIDLTPAEKDSISQSPYTNHFYLCAGTYGLVLEDRPTAQALVKECNLNERIFWGGNTDPVKFATIADVVDLMHHTSPKDSLLKLMKGNPDGYEDGWEFGGPEKKKRPAANEADDLAMADRLTSIAWLLKSLELWLKDVEHDAIKPMTVEITDRIAKVRNVEVLSAFITEYIDDFDAEKLRSFVSNILFKKSWCKENYKLPDGVDGPLDYWEKAYAAAKSSEWAKLIAEESSAAAKA
tara:strand:+ start:589 stop:1407 length:819 start_codon:yes stop_codon:yes gene_type:complete